MAVLWFSLVPHTYIFRSPRNIGSYIRQHSILDVTRFRNDSMGHTLSNVRLHLGGLLWNYFVIFDRCHLPVRCNFIASKDNTVPKSLDCSRDYCNGIFNRSVGESLGDNNGVMIRGYALHCELIRRFFLIPHRLQGPTPKQPTYVPRLMGREFYAGPQAVHREHILNLLV